MNNLENSFYGSSVRSYKNIQFPPSQQPHLLKYLHTQQKLSSEDNKNIDYTPIIVRNKSYDTFNKISEQPSREKNATISNRFYQSIVNSSSQQKYKNQVNQLQSQITRLMANQVGLKTEKELLRKENKQLNEEITYLSDKCTELQNKNEQLFKNQSRAVILERQYHKLQLQYESYKNNCRNMHENHLSSNHFTNLPTKIQAIYDITDKQQLQQIQSMRLRARMMSPTLPNNKFSQKVGWKRVGSPPVSPIYKLDTYKKANNRFQDVSLIESKIDKIKGDDLMISREINQNQVKDHTKTLDLKDLEKIKDYDSNIRNLEQELKELRIKNIALFKRGEEYEREKMKFHEDINELNYERAKLISDCKIRQNELKKQLELIKLQSESKQIKIIDFTQSLQLKTQQLKQLNIQKRELQQKIQFLSNSKKINQQQSLKLAQLAKKIEEYQRQLSAIKQRYTSIQKKKDQLEIQCKLYIHQLQDKKQSIAALQSIIQNIKQQMKQKGNAGHHKDALLKEQSILNKPQTIIDDNMLNIEQASVQTDQIQNQPKLLQQFSILRDHYSKLQAQHNVWGYQLNKLRVQNNFLNDNYLKLSQLHQQMRVQNVKLKELSVAWRQIESKAFAMKQLDEAVDHLWQVKEVQYQNLHSILSKIPEN